ncbi:hypothetical protein QYZ87_04745 [Porphyromonadaceae bacterium W3.11]|nr:hypothetical protein [Porphyromonadaceae bacterium W3.11]
MAFQYKIIQRKNRLKDNQVMQSAMQVNRGRVPIRDIAKRLEQITSLGRGDVMNVLTHLGEVVAEYIRLGYSVNLHELGTFTPRLSSRSVPAGEKFTADYIKGVNMRFTPSTYIKDELKQLQLECSENVCSIGKKEESEKETRPAEPGSGEDLGI